MGDESTAGESQMSVASSEMSVVRGGEGGGVEGRGKRMMFLGAVGTVLVLLIVAGIMYGSSTENPTEAGGDDGGAGNPGVGNGQGSGGSGNGYASIKTTSSTTLPKSQNPGPVIPSGKRDSILVCVIGNALSSSEEVDHSFCDYMIFSDLSISDGKVVGTHGRTSWHLFKKLMGVAANKTIPGGSFITAHTENANGPISASSLTPGILQTLTDPPLKMRALGFLGIQYPRINVALFKDYYKVFKTALSNQDKAMTFIGVVITDELDGNNFAKEIASFSDLDTIILETHITHTATGAHPKACTSHYMSYKVGVNATNVPTFKIANTTATHIRKTTQKFRIMFSSSSGVMLFIGDDEITTHGQSCDKALLLRPSVLCDLTTIKDFTIDSNETAAYTVWEKDRRHHFLATMEHSTTEELIGEYVVDQFDGWALFNIELDQHLNCSLADRVADLKTISQIATSRKSKG